jgi:Spy/CpxP family protein refolding chaperone
MNRTSYPMIGLALVLTLALARGGIAQQQQHHPQQHSGGTSGAQAQPAATDAKVNEEDEEDEQAPMQQMQGMMGQLQDMMRQMRGMMGPGGMMGQGGMMMQRHIERLAQQLGLSDDQRAQAQPLLRNHAKEVIRLKADIDTTALDVRQLLDADPVDLAKVKPLLQTIAAKEADLRLAHITAMQDIRKLLTPEQQKQFRTMQGHRMGDGGMMGRGSKTQ